MLNCSAEVTASQNFMFFIIPVQLQLLPFLPGPEFSQTTLCDRLQPIKSNLITAHFDHNSVQETAENGSAFYQVLYKTTARMFIQIHKFYTGLMFLWKMSSKSIAQTDFLATRGVFCCGVKMLLCLKLRALIFISWEHFCSRKKKSDSENASITERQWKIPVATSLLSQSSLNDCALSSKGKETNKVLHLHSVNTQFFQTATTTLNTATSHESTVFLLLF